MDATDIQRDLISRLWDDAQGTFAPGSPELLAVQTLLSKHSPSIQVPADDRACTYCGHPRRDHIGFDCQHKVGRYDCSCPHVGGR